MRRTTGGKLWMKGSMCCALAAPPLTELGMEERPSYLQDEREGVGKKNQHAQPSLSWKVCRLSRQCGHGNRQGQQQPAPTEAASTQPPTDRTHMHSQRSLLCSPLHGSRPVSKEGVQQGGEAPLTRLQQGDQRAAAGPLGRQPVLPAQRDTQHGQAQQHSAGLDAVQ